MSSFPEFQIVGAMSDWNSHYDNPDGFAKVAARRSVYDLVGEGVRIIDWDQEAINLLGFFGILREIEFADIGCSFPHLLEKMINAGYRGKNNGPLYGVEPNTQQFGKLGYWEPQDKNAGVSRLENLRLREGSHLNGIKLLRATAQELPFDDDALDVASLMFSAYHIPESKQGKAFDELKRVLRSNGLLLLATSGNDNKKGMRVNETKIAECLSEILKREVIAPEPLNSGFTSEKAVEVLGSKFDNVINFNHKFIIVISDKKRARIILDAYRSLIDMYKFADQQGSEDRVTKENFDVALQKVVLSGIERAISNGRFVTDTAVQDLFVASDSGLLVPENYRSLKAA
ncbi:MAG: methyltransferase domain-containing protein [Candidatus Saccharibacteria bacterium]|nr:methyltransferase domain-containing protein [Candidatus Saccharibacteria bacterium]